MNEPSLLQRRITLFLYLFISLLTFFLLHSVGKVLSDLGSITDFLLVLGMYNLLNLLKDSRERNYFLQNTIGLLPVEEVSNYILLSYLEFKETLQVLPSVEEEIKKEITEEIKGEIKE